MRAQILKAVDSRGGEGGELQGFALQYSPIASVYQGV